MIDMTQQIIRLKDELAAAKAEISRLTENQLLQDSATAAVLERAEKAEAELAACRDEKTGLMEFAYTVSRYANSYLQDERDERELCVSDKHHDDTVALFAAIDAARKEVLM